MSHPIRKQRVVARGFDSLEGRIVLPTVAATPPPPTLGGTLAQLGVIPANPQALPQAKAGSQLAKDLSKLQADSLAVQAGSGVTVGQITALRGDDNAIGTTGYKINGQALIKAQTDLALAVIAGNPSTAQAEFTALFGGKVSSTVINKAFADDVAVIRDSHVSAAALNAIAADVAAVAKDQGSQAPTPPPPSLGGSLSILGLLPNG